MNRQQFFTEGSTIEHGMTDWPALDRGQGQFGGFFPWLTERRHWRWRQFCCIRLDQTGFLCHRRATLCSFKRGRIWLDDWNAIQIFIRCWIWDHFFGGMGGFLLLVLCKSDTNSNYITCYVTGTICWYLCLICKLKFR